MNQQLTSLISAGLKYLIGLLVAALVGWNLLSPDAAAGIDAETASTVTTLSGFLATILTGVIQAAWKKYSPKGNNSDSGAGSGGTELRGVMVSGVTNPPGMNGFLALQHPLSPDAIEWDYRGTGDTVSRIDHVGDGEFHLFNEDDLFQFRAYATDYINGRPWATDAWTPRDGSGATGTVVVTPVYNG